MPKRSRSGRGSEGGAASRRRSSDAGASQGGGAQASAQAQLQDLSPEIEERLVRSAFRVVMYKHAKKEPATKTDIRDAIGKDYKAAVLEHVIRQAQSRFEALCGLLNHAGGFEPLEPAYLRQWLHTDQKVVLEEGGGAKTEVTVRGLTKTGYLLATDAAGARFELHPDGNSFDFFQGLDKKKLP